MKKKIAIISTIIVVVITLSITILLILNNKKNIDNEVDTNKGNEPVESTDSNNETEEGDDNMNVDNFTSKINININGTNYTATLEDNEATRELVKHLPLSINMSELNGNEKYHYLDYNLPTSPSVVGSINNGDIMLYGNNCLVLFYKTFNSGYSYTRIGKIDNPDSLASTVGTGSINITINK